MIRVVPLLFLFDQGLVACDGDRGSAGPVSGDSERPAPAIQVEPLSLEFASDGREQLAELLLRNRGQAALIWSAELQDDGAGIFFLDQSYQDAQLEPGASLTLSLRCQAELPADGLLLVLSDDPDQPELEVALHAGGFWARIDVPEDESGVEQGEPLELQGTVFDEQQSGALLVSWDSDLDGQLDEQSVQGSGPLSCRTASLSLGTHRVQLQAEREDGQVALDEISLHVGVAPAVELVWPPSHAWKPSGADFQFLGLAADDQDPQALSATWSSDVDGQLAVTAPDAEGWLSLVVDDLTPGAHVVTLSVSDASGLAASDQVELAVADCNDSSDQDGDGFSPAQGDCDDQDPGAYPGAESVLGDQRGNCDGYQVITIDGENEDDRLSYSFGQTGDINGDGLTDMLLPADQYDRGEDLDQGAIYLLLGRERYQASYQAAELALITPSFSTSGYGSNATVLPDLDGDGLDEVVGNCKGDLTSTVLFLGRQEWTGDEVEDVKLEGAGEDLAAGDFDGDGYGDLLMGSYRWDVGAAEDAGIAALTYGGADLAGVYDLSVEGDVVWLGEIANDRLGEAVANAGDVDQDGADDVLISVMKDDNAGGVDAGLVMLCSEVRHLAGVNYGDEDHWAAWHGEGRGQLAGSWDLMAGLGDVTGDGVDDFSFIAAGFDGDEDWSAGKIYGFSGAQLQPGLHSAGEADWSWVGDSYDDAFSRSAGEGLASAGDLDGDGLPDIFIGAHENDYNGEKAGKLWLFHSSERAGWGDEVGLSTADRIFFGEDRGDRAGRSLGGMGDLNQDGREDFAVGARDRGAGRAYVYLSGETCLD